MSAYEPELIKVAALAIKFSLMPEPEEMDKTASTRSILRRLQWMHMLDAAKSGARTIGILGIPVGAGIGTLSGSLSDLDDDETRAQKIKKHLLTGAALGFLVPTLANVVGMSRGRPLIMN